MFFRLEIIIKPLSGSEGRNVFFVHDKELSNLEQIIEAVAKEGYIIVQEYLPEVEKGDIRLFLMNGKPLKRGKSFAAFKRVSKGKDVRNNISAGGKPKKAKITKKMLDICEMIKPRLIQDGMFLVGLDIVGDKIIEINVFCPDGFQNIENVTGIDFSKEIIDALERKVEYRDYYNSRFDNNELATF